MELNELLLLVAVEFDSLEMLILTRVVLLVGDSPFHSKTAGIDQSGKSHIFLGGEVAV